MKPLHQHTVTALGHRLRQAWAEYNTADKADDEATVDARWKEIGALEAAIAGAELTDVREALIALAVVANEIHTVQESKLTRQDEICLQRAERSINAVVRLLSSLGNTNIMALGLRAYFASEAAYRPAPAQMAAAE